MILITSENWDGVIAPAIPSGWTVSNGTYVATVASTGMQAGAMPTSNPNVLGLLPAATTAAYFTAGYGTEDGTSGNIELVANFNFYAESNSEVGLYGRSTAINPSFSGNSFYYANIHDPIGSGTANSASIVVYNSGSATTLQTITEISWASDTWYQMTFALNFSFFTLQVQRLSDGYWLNGESAWQASAAEALNTSDSSISGQGYFGLSMKQADADAYLYTDDFYAYALNPASAYPPPPNVVRIPHLYYPQLAE